MVPPAAAGSDGGSPWGSCADRGRCCADRREIARGSWKDRAGGPVAPRSRRRFDPLRRVLLATDGSPSALRAAAWLGREAESLPEMRATIVHVVPVPGEAYAVGLTDGPIPAGDPAAEPFRRRAAATLEATSRAANLSPDRVELLAEIGDPARVVCRLAAQGFDAILVGHRGVSATRALLLGSVSEQVLARAPCPVIVVR